MHARYLRSLSTHYHGKDPSSFTSYDTLEFTHLKPSWFCRT